MNKETDAMTAPQSVDPARFLREQLDAASPDLLRDMVKTFADALMSAEADAICGQSDGAVGTGGSVRREAPAAGSQAHLRAGAERKS